MGSEAFVTSSTKKKKLLLESGEAVVIPPGQFALLLTEEKVKVPLGAIAFISMRFSIKRRGLINISGFHVDPGFSGRLKFSVYNAGPNDITISRGDRIFVMWFSDLDNTTADGYGDEQAEQNTISSADQNLMHGYVASPAELRERLQDVQNFLRNLLWAAGIIIAFVVAMFVRHLFGVYPTSLNQDDYRKLKDEISSEIRATISKAPAVSVQPAAASAQPPTIPAQPPAIPIQPPAVPAQPSPKP
jgi:dCTP deaminase